jgi:ATP-dependent protease HslVU (ClpYQ) peptidase subunit
MTCVVGVRTTKGVLLAGDQQMSWENGNRMSRDAKTLQLSDLLAIAYCGSGRLGQLLQYHLDELDDPPLGRDEQRWAVRDFVPFLRDVTEGAGHLHIHRNVEHLGESAFLLAVRGRLFMVEDDFSVVEHRYAFDALGSGMETAIGAMHTAAKPATYKPYTEARAQKIAEAGVMAATEYTNFVGGDISYAETVVYTDDERELARSIVRPR